MTSKNIHLMLLGDNRQTFETLRSMVTQIDEWCIDIDWTMAFEEMQEKTNGKPWTFVWWTSNGSIIVTPISSGWCIVSGSNAPWLF